MSFFDFNSLLGTAVGVVIGTILLKVFVVKNKEHKETISWAGTAVVTFLLACFFYFFRTDLTNYFKSTPFFPIFIVFVLLYITVAIWYFKIQKEDQIRKNMQWFTFLSLIYVGLLILFFMNDLERTFYLPGNWLFLIMAVSFAGAFFIYYRRINRKKKVGVTA